MPQEVIRFDAETGSTELIGTFDELFHARTMAIIIRERATKHDRKFVVAIDQTHNRKIVIRRVIEPDVTMENTRNGAPARIVWRLVPTSTPLEELAS